MKSDIILAGVGGQGIISIAAIIGMAALENKLYLKQAEVHGMSQRGGAVQSNLRISDKPVASDLIPKGSANLILSVEPMEALRYLPFLAHSGYLVTNTTPFINIPDYPEMDALLAEIKKIPHHIALNADEIAAEVGTKRASNIVMLGAATPFIDISIESFEIGIQKIFQSKGDKIIQTNIEALKAGRDFTLKNM